MRNFDHENLSHDPLHGYIPFIAGGLPAGEVAERTIIDHPWVQRLRQIHQLQTAWWVYPTAEHTRFQHVLGVMHLASRAVEKLYDSLCESCPETPSRGYVETLLRMAGLLHDVGHGPFGHFFDQHFLSRFGLTHETLGAHIIEHELGELLRGVRRNPYSQLTDDEQLDPREVAWLITRPEAGDEPDARPAWLRLLRSLLSGIYTIDNLDFVLRDAYMTGYSQRSYDLERLLHYSFFTPQGLTIHERGLEALVRFMSARAELFRSVYFHRTVRAIDLTLADLFDAGRDLLFPGSPLEHLHEYQRFTEWSLLGDVAGWDRADDELRRQLAPRWQSFLARQVPWKMACQRVLVFAEDDAERSSIFSDEVLVERQLRKLLAPELAEIPLRVDLARHIQRPHTRGPASGQNFLFDAARQQVRPLEASQLIRRLPVSHRICRVYTHSFDNVSPIATALDELIGPGGIDDLTNM